MRRAERARRRYLTIDKQGVDGLSRMHGLLDPQARATIDGVLAKLAAPGMCNPDDEAPCVDGAPSDALVRAGLPYALGVRAIEGGELLGCRLLPRAKLKPAERVQRPAGVKNRGVVERSHRRAPHRNEPRVEGPHDLLDLVMTDAARGNYAVRPVRKRNPDVVGLFPPPAFNKRSHSSFTRSRASACDPHDAQRPASTARHCFHVGCCSHDASDDRPVAITCQRTTSLREECVALTSPFPLCEQL